MPAKIKIGRFETTCLLINFICAKLFLNLPEEMANGSGTAGWLEILYVSVLALIYFWIFSLIYKGFEGKDILDISYLSFGDMGRIIAGLVFALPGLYIVGMIIREFAEDMKIISFPNTPTQILIFIFSIGAFVGAYLGIEAIVRVHALLVPIIIVVFISIIILAIPMYDTSKLMPLFGNGVKAIFFEGTKSISYFSELIVLFVLASLLKNKGDFKSTGFMGILISLFILTFGTLSYSLIYQYPISTEYYLPFYQITRLIRVSTFLNRMEAFFVLFWASVAFMYISLGLFIISFMLKKAFGLEHRRPIIFPLALIACAIAVIPENLSSAVLMESQYFRKYGWIIYLLLPLVILVIARLKSKKGMYVNQY